MTQRSLSTLHSEVSMIKASSRCGFTLALLMLAIFVTLPIHAQTFSVLYNFGINLGDPAHAPYSGLFAQGRDGNLYSTLVGGGTGNGGAVFKIST